MKSFGNVDAGGGRGVMAKKKRKVGAGGKPPDKTPSDYEGWLKRARKYLTECQLSDCYDCAFATVAIAAYDEAIALRPNDPTAWREKGDLLVLMSAGHQSQAHGALMRAVTLDPGNARAWMRLGACAVRRGDWAAARQYLDTAVSLDPEMRRWAEAEYDMPEEIRARFFAGDPSLGWDGARVSRTSRGT
jgi:cytochrome c-type biogenesis protein CcmH/NrfG